MIMATISYFEDLEIWQLAREQCKSLRVLLLNLKNIKEYELLSQIKRSSGSVMDNIAEGFERGGNAEFNNFLSIGKGSNGELRSQMYRALDYNFICMEDFNTFAEQNRILGMKINAFMNYLRSSNFKGTKFRKDPHPKHKHQTSNIKHQTIMTKAITKTNFNFPKQKGLYVGKVRDVYNIDGKYLVMVVTDRISAFDVVLPKGIPYKGQVLNQIASKFLDATADIVPNWKISSPDPMVTIGHFATPFKVEMVIRGYLTGHAWREYKSGKRSLCGIPMPDGMVENQKFDQPIITPTTKADEGHDLDISRDEIIRSGLVSEHDYILLEKYTGSYSRKEPKLLPPRD